MRSTRSQSETSHKVNMAAVVDLTNDDDDNQELRVMVNMAPVPKNTVKAGQGRHCVDNQTRRKMNEFGAIVKAKAKAEGFTKIEREIPVEITIWCFKKRPAVDFVSKHRMAGNLQATALSHDKTVVAVKPDVDNCAEFVLDSAKGTIWDDDAQVVKLTVMKLRDNLGLCLGRVALHVKKHGGSHDGMLPDFS